MKYFLILLLSLTTTVTVKAQANFFNEQIRFNRFMDKVNSPKGDKLMYADIEGNAYFAKGFATANIENATSLIKARYNTYTDTVELLNGEEIFELPKTAKYSRIMFQSPAATLLLMNVENLPQGYYFELVPGKYSLLGKRQVEFREGAKAINSFTPAIAPKFEAMAPIYYLKNGSQIIKIGKKESDFVNALPDHKNETADFIKKNKIKLNKEEDLIKLVKFLNSAS